ncbi:MAG: methyltransferase domain-containing protein [Chitinophagaceae bacterium]|nr:methyltransferase domain-containing protein [Anaerolineae bacterium]
MGLLWSILPMSLRFHEISEADHRILNPFDEEKLMLLAELCHLREGMRLLDLACGKGELLARWAQRHKVIGVGVDLSAVFIEAANARAYELDIIGQMTFIEGDAADYPQEHHQFDVVSCLGATWIGGGLVGTLNLMATALKPSGGLLIVGEPYWLETPTPEAAAALGYPVGSFATLEGTLDRFEANGLELIDMVLADGDNWDRYVASQWNTVHQWLRENPNDPDTPAMRLWIAKNRRDYLTYGRQTMGWGVFILAATHKASSSAPRVENHSRPVDVEIRDDMLWVGLHDGRVIGNPLAWYPWLQQATPDSQTAFDFDAFGINFSMLGKRIDVDALLRGRGE